MLPTTIDDVLVRLNQLLDAALLDGCLIVYFVALYERVTSNVRHALIAGSVFDDGPRMEKRGSPILGSGTSASSPC